MVRTTMNEDLQRIYTNLREFVMVRNLLHRGSQRKQRDSQRDLGEIFAFFASFAVQAFVDHCIIYANSC